MGLKNRGVWGKNKTLKIYEIYIPDIKFNESLVDI